MPRRQDIDLTLRTRLAKWTLHFMREYTISSYRAFAERIGMAGPTVTNLVNHGSGGGIDYLAALHRTFGKSADTLLDADPPSAVQLPPSHPAPVGGAPPPQRPIASPPRHASPQSPATRRKKGTGGGLPT